MVPALPGFQFIKRCIQYLDCRPHNHIFCLFNSYDGSNVIRLAWSGNQAEYYTVHTFIETFKDADHARIITRIWSVLGINKNILGFALFWKIHIQPAVSSDSTDV